MLTLGIGLYLGGLFAFLSNHFFHLVTQEESGGCVVDTISNEVWYGMAVRYGWDYSQRLMDAFIIVFYPIAVGFWFLAIMFVLIAELVRKQRVSSQKPKAD